ncbi:MAG: hypothetical protein WBB19_15525 [Desulforhopalus sp.]
MQFCKDCGTVLNLFGNNERELCSSCIQYKNKVEPPAAPVEIPELSVPKEENFELLADAVLTCGNNKMVLHSKEGWELWSAPATAKVSVKTILDRARRIYEIRLRRQKN